MGNRITQMLEELRETPSLYKKHLMQVLLILTTIEGIPAFILLFRIHSDRDSAFLFGFSPERIVLGGIALLLLLLLTYLSVKSFTNHSWFEDILFTLEEYIQKSDRIAISMLIIAYITILGVLIELIFALPLGEYFGSLRAVYDRSFSIIRWGTLATAQTLAFIFVAYHSIREKVKTFTTRMILRYLWGLVIVSFTLLHILILVLRESVLFHFPYWWGWFNVQPFSLRDLLFLGLIFFALWVVGRMKTFSIKGYRHLILILVLGYVTQVSFAFIRGGSFDSLQTPLYQSNQVRYLVNAGPNLNLSRAIVKYEERYGTDETLRTKPPGALVFYIFMEKISNLSDPRASYEERRENLVRFATLTFPVFSLLGLCVLYLLGREFLEKHESWTPSLILSLVPCFALQTLLLDQFLYPLLFMIGIFLAWKTVTSESFWIGMLSGGFIYVSVFTSFSLIALLAMTFTLLGLRMWKQRKHGVSKRLFYVSAGVAISVILTGVLFYIGFGYDPFLRYSKALAVHRSVKLLQPDLQQVFLAVVQNNLEFVFWVGAPIFLLAISRWLRAGMRLLKERMRDIDLVAISFFVTYFLLNLLGQTRGEVGRLWIFLVPGFILLAIDELKYIFGFNIKIIKVGTAVQLITAYLLLKTYSVYF
ncbi:MAG TPA: hypothetical protein G4O11_07535 [Anaerolineae bacterium]|nr:MAG: hypothetical protein AMJ88_17085 [Anaerolineae bacterium SM23_ 63]HEY43818.1 hypothetical protein [Anaerolineae bacterium]